MEISYNVTGAKRKELVNVISKATGMKAVYKFMPTCNFEIGSFTVNKEGTLLIDAHADNEEVARVLEAIAAASFEGETQDTQESPAEDASAEEVLAEEESLPSQEDATEAAELMETDTTEETDNNKAEAADSMEEAETTEAEESSTPEAASERTGLTVEIPLDKVDVGNLTKLLDAKGGLIKKALGISELPIEVLEEKAAFPWFGELPDNDAVQAYTHFISALCQMSKNAKRVTVTEKAVDNEKYAFRCFLLRLGFIGAEYKTERKILLKNLTGSSAFRNGGKKHEASEQGDH
ncbi:hypothetical protein CL3_07250 [butyrate-producing bacterium SM4/1]|nr:hypothetical protein CL3_07250 [butyrate-producing bacterium SM4/1]